MSAAGSLYSGSATPGPSSYAERLGGVPSSSGAMVVGGETGNNPGNVEDQRLGSPIRRMLTTQKTKDLDGGRASSNLTLLTSNEGLGPDGLDEVGSNADSEAALSADHQEEMTAAKQAMENEIKERKTANSRLTRAMSSESFTGATSMMSGAASLMFDTGAAAAASAKAALASNIPDMGSMGKSSLIRLYRAETLSFGPDDGKTPDKKLTRENSSSSSREKHRAALDDLFDDDEENANNPDFLLENMENDESVKGPAKPPAPYSEVRGLIEELKKTSPGLGRRAQGRARESAHEYRGVQRNIQQYYEHQEEILDQELDATGRAVIRHKIHRLAEDTVGIEQH